MRASGPETRSTVRPLRLWSLLLRDSVNIGALIVGIGLWGPSYYKYKVKEVSLGGFEPECGALLKVAHIEPVLTRSAVLEGFYKGSRRVL